MFAPMLVGAAVGSAAAFLSVRQYYRQQFGPMTLRESRLLRSMPSTPIALAHDGLVKLVGTIGSDAVSSSYYHRTPCACLELHHYDVVAAGGRPKRTLTKIERQLHEFWVEDETGRVIIDPEHARIDYEIEGTDIESAIEEHRLRVGERVVVMGRVRRAGPRLTQPMRRAAADFDNRLEFIGEPLVTWRSEPEVYPRILPPAGGVALSAGSVGLAVLGSLLNL